MLSCERPDWSGMEPGLAEMRISDFLQEAPAQPFETVPHITSSCQCPGGHLKILL